MSRRQRVQERVRWSDVDASGIIRWSTYTRFVELAETELFRAVEFPYAEVWERLDIWLPRVQCHFDYRSPARLDELLDVDMWVGRIGRSSIRLRFEVRKPDQTCAMEGYMVIVAIRRGDGRAVGVPDALRQALEPFVADDDTASSP